MALRRDDLLLLAALITVGAGIGYVYALLHG
jgi:hypothetical protein